jgi:hypothetical protein
MSVPRYGSLLDTPERADSTAELLIPSRGPPPKMEQLGIITHERCSEVFGLFGQRRHPASARYEYYYEPSFGSAGRVPLCTPRHTQLYTGDNLTLPGKKGAWKVTLFEPRR